MSDAPRPASLGVSERMKRTRRRDTAAELRVRSAVHRRGLRYRVDQPVLPGDRRRADLVFRRHRVAVFIDGCFWHSCPLHGTQPKRNGEWWLEKLAGNVERDRDTDARLGRAGWTVVRVWEHEDAEVVADRISAALIGVYATPAGSST